MRNFKTNCKSKDWQHHFPCSPSNWGGFVFLQKRRRKSEFEMLTDTTKQTPIFMRKLNSSRFSFPGCLASLPAFLRLLFKHFSCVGKPPGEGVHREDNVAGAGAGARSVLSGRRHKALRWLPGTTFCGRTAYRVPWWKGQTAKRKRGDHLQTLATRKSWLRSNTSPSHEVTFIINSP